MNRADAAAVAARCLKLWPTTFNAEHAAVVESRLLRIEIDLEQAHAILDEELVNPSGAKVSRAAAVMARFRAADGGKRAPFVAGDDRHGTVRQRSWSEEWAERLGLATGDPGAAVEAWAVHRWREAKGLPDDRRRRVLGWIVRELVRTFGTDADARDYVREMLNLKPDNPALVRRFGPAQEVAA